MGRPVPPHRLRPNEKVWTPPSVIVLDTESRWHVEGLVELHELRLWCAVHVDRRAVRKKAGPVKWGFGETPDSLAGWLDSRTKGRETVWVYAHNLNFDLVTTNLAETMAERDWEVSEFSVNAGAPWLRLRRGRYVITVVDSWSWLPQAVESLATIMGDVKPALPANAGGDWEWLGRCAKDVDVTARSILGLMEWWDTEQLGRWTISGPGSGWNAMRHVESATRHVIQQGPTDEEIPVAAGWVREMLDAGCEHPYVFQDRQSVRGGRKDAAVIRSERGGPFVELDIRQAYPTVARELPLPVKRAWTFDGLEVGSKWVGSRFYGVIAEAHIRTDRPRYPVRHGGVTWYPVGEFKTVLAGPELAWARENGDLVAVGAGQAHKLAMTLRPWATWVLDPSRRGERPVPAVAGVACKTWGRAVIGKFAARGHTSELMPGDAPSGWSVMDRWDRRVGRRGAEVTMQGRKWMVTYDGDTENCYPAVLGWVESEVRVRLGRLLELLDGGWWSCDTDGLLVDMSTVEALLHARRVSIRGKPRDHLGLAEAVCDVLAGYVSPLVVRPKKVVESLEVLGPQHLVVGGERRYSGVSAKADEVAPGKFVGRDWPKLKWQMENSRPGVYARPEREATFTGPTVHRWVMGDGTTRPVEMAIDDEGANQLVPFSASRYAGEVGDLAWVQYRLLEAVS